MGRGTTKAVLMDYYNGPASNVFENVPRRFSFSTYCLLQSFTIICGT